MKNKKDLAKILLTCSLLAGCGAGESIENTTSATNAVATDSVQDVTEKVADNTATHKSADHKCGGSSCGAAASKKSDGHKCGGSVCGAGMK